MDVNKENFDEVIPSILEAIEEADFIAIDCEFTGVSPSSIYSILDTVAERYSKLKKANEDFIIIQIGVSCFHYHHEQNKFTHKDFNVFIFPADNVVQTEDSKFSSMEKLKEEIGARIIWDKIQESKKLVVGHNILLDMMHILKEFFCPIPDGLDDFKELLHGIFPHIVDTKVLASSKNLKKFFKESALEQIVKTILKQNFEIPDISVAESSKGYHINSHKQHEAGYDAFSCGFVFINMVTKLVALENGPVQFEAPYFEIVAPYANRIFITKIFDTHTVNVCEFEPEKDKSNVLFVTVPETWKSSELVKLFKPYGKIAIEWINMISACVTMENLEKADYARSDLLKKPDRKYSIDFASAVRKHQCCTSSSKRRASDNFEDAESVQEHKRTDSGQFKMHLEKMIKKETSEE